MFIIEEVLGCPQPGLCLLDPSIKAIQEDVSPGGCMRRCSDNPRYLKCTRQTTLNPVKAEIELWLKLSLPKLSFLLGLLRWPSSASTLNYSKIIRGRRMIECTGMDEVRFIRLWGKKKHTCCVRCEVGFVRGWSGSSSHLLSLLFLLLMMCVSLQIKG